MVVKLIKEQPGLTLGKCYTVIGIEWGDYRLVNDMRDPCLYSPEHFTTVDPIRPGGWIVEYDEDGVERAYPPPFQLGFFEDYHDGDPEAIKIFWDYIKSHDIDHK